MFRRMKLHFNILFTALLLVSTLPEVRAQEIREITGYVYSAADNTPLPGIKVSTKYRQVESETTDESGKFVIELRDSTDAKEYMLVFSYPGYEPKEQYGRPEDDMMVYMTLEGEYSVDKTVHYPYEGQKYSKVSSAVEPIKIEYSTQIMSASFEELLLNSTAQLTSSSGTPREGYAIKIRGYSTLFSDEKPLIVIDGQILSNYRFDETTIEGFFHDPLINIDPRNIEAITILKDASAAALYGAKASNGVILIKTKTAKVGETVFDITGHSGGRQMMKRLPVMQESEYFKTYLLEQLYGNPIFLYEDYFNENPSSPNYYRFNNAAV